MPAHQPPPPTKSYILIGVQRSGSTLLCEALRASQFAGYPTEIFYNTWLGGYTKFAGLPPSIAADASPEERRASFDHIVKVSTTANGVFGTNLMWSYWQETMRLLRTMPGCRIEDDVQLLRHLLPDLRFVRISRRDRVAQAVSWSKAEQTGRFSSTQAGRPDARPRYDAEHIGRHHRFICNCEAQWDGFLRDHGLDPLHVYYEDLIADYQGTMRAVLDAIGVTAPPGFEFAVPLQRQADTINAEWAARFRADLQRS